MPEFEWDQIDVDETITEQDQAASNDLVTQTPVGTFVVTVTECEPTQKDFKDYSCMSAALKMRVDGLVKVELPVKDQNGKPVIREGEPVMKVQDVPEGQRAELEAILLGQIIKDDVFLFHPKEKENTKRRRLFVAKRLGLITADATAIGAREWAAAPGHKALVTTEWNTWTDKDTKEIKKNVKVGWSGYDFYKPNDGGQGQAGTSQTSGQNQDDFSDI